ncbi:oxidoreductase-like protein [Rhizodiscina lignyota]|uniref:Oxidoreductase-like protein n=1 Tax=Rhizodiscina lignyota TaxID=1504668 RepID=A0A9P4M0L9_9PEZI|nr:oxidoreductase-like protein [Rhizodiscina lignyota]
MLLTYRRTAGSTHLPSCQHHPYMTRILSHNPLSIYIEDFLTTEERLHLQNLAVPLFQASTVGNFDTKGTQSGVKSSFRNSSSAKLHEHEEDPVITCIKQRAAAFQGYMSPDNVEPLVVVRYQPGQFYDYHNDWFPVPARFDGHYYNRVSSFFVYLDDNCEGGATHFPMFPKVGWEEGDSRQTWCDHIECDPTIKGVAVKSKAGNAVFWINLNGDTQGDNRAIHSGLPVKNGTKYGLNIFSLSMVPYIPES